LYGDPDGEGATGACLALSGPSISNFAAMLFVIGTELSPADQATLQIIDAFSNGNYSFWDVSVGFCIHCPFGFLVLHGAIRNNESK
jgi:hypothetical protein